MLYRRGGFYSEYSPPTFSPRSLAMTFDFPSSGSLSSLSSSSSCDLFSTNYMSTPYLPPVSSSFSTSMPSLYSSTSAGLLSSYPSSSSWNNTPSVLRSQYAPTTSTLSSFSLTPPPSPLVSPVGSHSVIHRRHLSSIPEILNTPSSSTTSHLSSFSSSSITLTSTASTCSVTPNLPRISGHRPVLKDLSRFSIERLPVSYVPKSPRTSSPSKEPFHSLHRGRQVIRIRTKTPKSHIDATYRKYLMDLSPVASPSTARKTLTPLKSFGNRDASGFRSPAAGVSVVSKTPKTSEEPSTTVADRATATSGDVKIVKEPSSLSSLPNQDAEG